MNLYSSNYTYVGEPEKILPPPVKDYNPISSDVMKKEENKVLPVNGGTYVCEKCYKTSFIILAVFLSIVIIYKGS